MESLPKITHTATKYLQAIQALKGKGNVRQIDVAKHLNVRPSTCFESVLRLMQKNLVTENFNKHLSLTSEGQTLLSSVEQNHYIFSSFFREVLGECCEDAEKIAAVIEPTLELNTALSMCRFNHFLEHIKDKKVDFWAEWKDFSLDPSKDEPCLDCAHRKHCLKKQNQKKTTR